MTRQVLTIKKLLLYLSAFVFWCIFYSFLPFAGDDWAWGSELGLQRLNNGFNGYNGRYLGNILIIVITRSVVARVLFCSIIMFLLIFVMSKIFDTVSLDGSSNKNFIIAFSSVLVLVLPNQINFGEIQPFQIFGSTIGWLSGFTNYVVPSVLILIYYYFITIKNENKIINIFLVFDGIFACLCVEHYTLFCLMFSFFVIAYRLYFYKKICKKSVAFLIGSVTGSLIMFSNSSYQLMQKGDVSTNQRAVGFLGSFKQYVSYILPKNANKSIFALLEILLFAVVVFVVIFFSIKIVKAIINKNIVNILPLVCMFLMTLPLLFTNSGKEIYVIAPRCYFLQYFMLVIYVYCKILQKYKISTAKKKYNNYLKLSFLVLVLFTVVTYIQLDYMGFIRNDLVDKALEDNSSTVEIVEYPENAEHIQWSSNFINKETYLERYINFKHIPKDKDIKIITYND